jgi:hypothetical protein
MPAVASHGGTIYFTSYDGADTWPLNDQNVVSSEIKPASANSSIFVADYLVGTAESGTYEHGTVSLNMPTADVDSNGVFDWLQKDMAVDASFNGNSNVHWLAPGAISANALITGQLIRSAGSNSGSYTTTYSIAGSTITAQGIWWISHWSGSLSYADNFYSINISTSDSEGKIRNLSGTSSLTKSNTEQIQLQGITLTEGSDNLEILGSTLSRSGNSFTGKIKAVDGGFNTSWNDFIDWHVKIIDNNDRDGNGIPDLADLPPNASIKKVVFVDDNASSGGDGTSWATAFKHLQDAL